MIRLKVWRVSVRLSRLWFCMLYTLVHGRFFWCLNSDEPCLHVTYMSICAWVYEMCLYPVSTFGNSTIESLANKVNWKRGRLWSISIYVRNTLSLMLLWTPCYQSSPPNVCQNGYRCLIAFSILWVVILYSLHLTDSAGKEDSQTKDTKQGSHCSHCHQLRWFRIARTPIGSNQLYILWCVGS